ncbi:aldo-keto reductase [Grosmannia clavigera kw1407]|uniref:Aldo-keto reductase n=1 Tax=Grosmannia clavigera (strain kw1407 / UAMH 11150) TaxID=655863 RepID=F0XJB9_GROCL|nr:aldo-keto reductase [Grosmannia clavigera kw1407]EFX02213.1 aldo-keto reductase [Grosmannia clavigera kw1407]
MSLPTRQLGRNGPQVTAMGFGLMGLSAFYGSMGDEAERFAFLDHLYASGERFWDTADMYGDSEDLLGRWFKKNPGARETIFLASKFGFTPDRTIRSDPAYAKEACARSLSRLGIDHIDLYYVHRVDTVTPIEDTVEALVDLKKQGKIRYIGLSEVSPTTLRRACAVHPIAAVQMEYSPFELIVEQPKDTGLLATCRELGVALVAYSPLGRGLLTGQYRSPADFGKDDFRVMMPRFSPENFPKNLALVDTLSSLASSKGCTTSQLTLAWLMHQGDDIFPIPGTKKIKYYDDNLGALSVKLTDAEAAAIRTAVDSAEIVGERYPPQMSVALMADTPEKK